MSATQDIRPAVAEEFETFISRYAEQDLVDAVQSGAMFEVSYRDLHQFNPDLAADWLADPDWALAHLSKGIEYLDLPIDIDPAELVVGLVDLHEAHVYYPDDLSAEIDTDYIGVRGTFEQMTVPKELATRMAFECNACGMITHVDQHLEADKLIEPSSCSTEGCNGRSFTPRPDLSDSQDFAQAQVVSPPGKRSTSKAVELTCNIHDELLDIDGGGGLAEQVGSEVIFYGRIKRIIDDGRIFDRQLDVSAVEFPNDSQSVNVDEYKDAVIEEATADNAIERFQESLAPPLYQTPAWETAFEWTVCYAFGAPNIYLDDGTTYRGDIHGAIISDFGMGKSLFASSLDRILPESIKRSATALASDVNLRAAAVENDFGDTQ